MEGQNQLALSGQIVELQPRRLTPGGVPVVAGTLQHTSRQLESGLEREVQCEMSVVAVGDSAKLLELVEPGRNVLVRGFVAARNKRSRSLVLHIQTLSILEGNENGFQTETS
ncbi:primosomal replication protein N [Cognatazoarcus halotolerans]|uniref:primosomal replication protein N n=1 Tax=Cognatazoarcus halotolerans TaxID=2686016 RepID=UPI001357DE75|nr:primosomal replication protein N [Cognatazoarcus halotolerans]MCB1901214.1 primosomal replication protein N [Rhodocyclaceae bacterium]MCP5311373.1 primosomal replication protein N [Zoogloeaceae bacterium]